jgi:ADP-ribose pyrophosphatase YjhB (NUDIX family)
MLDHARVAVRIVLLDACSHVLLFEGRDLADRADTVRFWFTAGGGADDGESLTHAAERELLEETGQAGLRLVGPFCRHEFDFLNHGARQHQVEHFFAARTGDTSLSVHGWSELERRATTRWRWWSPEELETEGVPYFPSNLVDLMRRADALV